MRLEFESLEELKTFYESANNQEIVVGKLEPNEEQDKLFVFLFQLMIDSMQPTSTLVSFGTGPPTPFMEAVVKAGPKDPKVRKMLSNFCRKYLSQ